MAKDGQARVLSHEDFNRLLEIIKQHRHPEKNTLIMQISFKLGLRVQEISLLRIKEVIDLGSQHALGYKIKEVLVLPKNFTKGARAVKRSNNQTSARQSVRFNLEEFGQLIQQVEKMAKANIPINPEDFYPHRKKSGGKTRELPIVDKTLKNAIKNILK